MNTDGAQMNTDRSAYPMPFLPKEGTPSFNPGLSVFIRSDRCLSVLNCLNKIKSVSQPGQPAQSSATVRSLFVSLLEKHTPCYLSGHAPELRWSQVVCHETRFSSTLSTFHHPLSTDHSPSPSPPDALRPHALRPHSPFVPPKKTI